jgi:succinate dehydrogenase / fumarate reductase, iron-sulfur subunit
MEFTIHAWRQKNSKSTGELRTYKAKNISPDMSFLEMINEINGELAVVGEEPIHYYADCLEGICGSCSMMINGIAHGPGKGVTTCQLYMRSFNDGEEITVEPWRAEAFPIVKDLVCDRSAFDRIQQAGGYVSVNTGAAPDGNAILISQEDSNTAMDAAQCIGCGACVASCKNSSAMLFTAAKISQLRYLPQGQPERDKRVLAMVKQMDEEGFGNCTNQYECEAVCPKSIPVRVIAEMNRDYIAANIRQMIFGRESE